MLSAPARSVSVGNTTDRHLIKKLVVAAVAAAGISVPLAGVAWADPAADLGSNGNGVAAGDAPTPKSAGAIVGSAPGGVSPDAGARGVLLQQSAINGNAPGVPDGGEPSIPDVVTDSLPGVQAIPVPIPVFEIEAKSG